jgi:GxxExxY protein
MIEIPSNRFDSITEIIISCAYKVLNTLGTGFLEKVYENAMILELNKNGLFAEAQKPLKIFYNGLNIGEYMADIVVENLVIIELKVAKCIDRSHIAQTINYLKASSLHFGLILNFKNTPLEIKRVIL